MIDIHCHILPNVDDGPEDMETSIKMARAAVQDGIKTIIATPHQNSRYTSTPKDILSKIETLNGVLSKQGIDIHIVSGQEIRIYGELLQEYETRKLLSLNNGKYILIEFPTNHVPRYAQQLLFNLQSEGYVPVIAHPERNSEIVENPDLLYKFIKTGALSQVTAQSVMGGFNKKTMKFSHQLIEHNLAHFVASDAHGIQARGFNMTAAYATIEKEFGSDYVYLFKENAQNLLDGINIYREIPEPLVKRKKFLGIF